MKKILSLPSRSTLKRYVASTTGQTVSSLIKQRLSQEAKNVKNDYERFGSLIVDEMAIKSRGMYNRYADECLGNVSMNGLEKEVGMEDVLANRLLCFVFSGLSTKMRLPVAYYFTKTLTGDRLHSLTIDVLKEVEKVGFFVICISCDNHKINKKTIFTSIKFIIAKTCDTASSR